jgi:multidrug efflux system membrane fusion protein
MNQPVRNLREQARPLAEPLQNKGRSRRRFAVISALALLVVAGVLWWSRQEIAPRPSGGGRNAGAMSIVPEVVGKGDIGINLNALVPSLRSRQSLSEPKSAVT